MMKTHVLYVFADQLSMLALNLFGARNRVHTPHIDELGAKGVKFHRSYCVTPQCSPSRSSILTGLYPHKTGVIGNIGTKNTAELDAGLPNLGNILQQRGYRTAYFGKWHLGRAAVTEYGFEATADFQKDDEETTEHVLNFLDEQADVKDHPWLCMVSFNNPHDIYRMAQDKLQGKTLNTSHIILPDNFIDDLSAKPEAQRLFRDEDQGKALQSYGEEDWKYYLAYYYELIERIDRLLGRIITKLKDTGQYEHTLIVFTSDHGDMMAAHRSPFKGPMMYEELVKIPLIYCWEGVLPAGESRYQMTVNADHLPTIIDLLGFEVPEQFDGVSMKESLFKRETAGREYVVMQYYSKQKWINPIRTITDGKHKYSLYSSGEEELYDLAADGSESHNGAYRPDDMEIKKRLQDELRRWMKQYQDPFEQYTRTDRQGQLLEK
ncbi:sulfatase [Paenibacillus radicis (ex Xue et al. 2023)]|uniref:Sulfatase-like hydrolase/transferase n=1 Tax=Paenibacillus radicis (ex Xue et al. 2023) TaxID=2972489 RepID=A0ABT1YJ16_9BACL|nr:sulfatase-like hydrolase/transferase [Paenibacillus radicis (ex Xue et al. 2023)]MCR8632263.1 sulfatase-like hydrolase/transferase [Paenibacillus radicis (ex Xue et al. 2023)]